MVLPDIDSLMYKIEAENIFMKISTTTKTERENFFR